MDSLNDMTLAQLDPEIQAVLDAELGRQRDTLEMIASENFVPALCLRRRRSDEQVRRGLPGSSLLRRLRVRGCRRVPRHRACEGGLRR